MDGNIERDKINQSKLKELGWTVFVIWECLIGEGTTELLTHLKRLREDSEPLERRPNHWDN